MRSGTNLNVLIASYLEPNLVERIRAVDSRLAVVYEPGLLRAPRYAADHTGHPLVRSADQEAAWHRHLAAADVLFDFDQTHRDDLPDLAPNVRWIQATSAGIGEFVAAHGYARRMPSTTFTTASGVHARPLAEFSLMAMIMFAKGLFGVLEHQRRSHWQRRAGTDLAGRTVGIVGVGRIGSEVARLARAAGMRVLGTTRSARTVDVEIPHVDELYAPEALADMLERSEYLVLVAPHTRETERLIGAAELARLPPGAVLINIGRGAVVDEPALVEALRSNHLGGAALDVFAEEPLPVSSPLWSLPNVLVSPHSASTSDRENGRIVDLFCDNLRRFLAGEPLRNVLDAERGY